MSKRSAYQYGIDKSGQKHWRSLSEYANTPEFQQALQQEFPEGASELNDGVGRRSFVGLMGASLGLAGLSACRRPEQKILPYNQRPEDLIEGAPQFYATAFPWNNTAIGLLVEAHDGRPTKIEGNPDHPDSLGGTNLYAQASILDLYDPDRSTDPSEKGVKKRWAEAAEFLAARGKLAADKQGAGLVFLTEAHRSPTLDGLLKQVTEKWPQAKIFRYDPLSRYNHLEGNRLALNVRADTVLDVKAAKVIVSLDSDFLQTEGSTVRQARGFADGRRIEGTNADGMNRLYVVESSYSVTGANADHRLRLSNREIAPFTFALASELATRHGVDLGGGVAAVLGNHAPAGEKAAKWVVELATDLASHKGEVLIVAGQRQPPVVHALAALMNLALGAAGKTVRYVPPFSELDDTADKLAELTGAMNSNAVETLVILGGNPVYTAPGELKFAEALKKVPATIHVADYVDETSAATQWHLNRAHYLEQWSDVRAVDGTNSIVQPLIAPLHDGKTDAEVVELVLGGSRGAHELVREEWRKYLAADAGWREALHKGFAATASGVNDVAKAAEPSALVATLTQTPFAPVPKAGLEVVFHPDSHHWDGRFANNGWLSEMPDPMTKVAWGHAALLSPATAKALGIGLSASGDVLQFDHMDTELVEISVGGAKVKLPALVAPGQADDSISITLGWGRTAGGKIATGTFVGGNGAAPVQGADVNALRSLRAGFWAVQGASVTKTGETEFLARTQEHNSMEGRALVREQNLVPLHAPKHGEEHAGHGEHGGHEAGAPSFKDDPSWAKKAVELPSQKQLNLFSNADAIKYDGHRWGMVIDLGSCIGCNTCMVACQSENNIPLVGKDGVLKGREMHWIRIDRYFTGSVDDPSGVVHQPIGCHHCENAPCELVCPVAATTHSVEGLNDMAYNRCVGTRYCANNCPYKVRRFNYFNYNKDIPEVRGNELRKMKMNPNVTVRARGVMEKCTYCVQRIQEAKIKVKREQRLETTERLVDKGAGNFIREQVKGSFVRDGEVVSACAQACPTSAITFGDLADPKSKVAQRAAEPREYKLLEELNIRPRTSFLARIRNPNPALENA